MSNNIISIILINYNTPQITYECVSSICNSVHSNYDIFIIDNGSSEDNNKILCSLIGESAKIIHLSNNLGYVGGINYALKVIYKLNYDYILIMNNDTIIDSEALSSLVEASKRYNDMCIVTGKVYSYNYPNKLVHIGSMYNNKYKLERVAFMTDDLGQFDEEKFRDMIDDVFWLIPINIAKDVGFYSDYFWFNCEQADYALRAKKKGYSLLYTPKAKIWHREGATLGGKQNPVRQYWDVKSYLVFNFLHSTRVDFMMEFLIVFMVFIKKSFIFCFNPFKWNVKCCKYILAYLYAMRDTIKWIRNKQPDNGSFPQILKL